MSITCLIDNTEHESLEALHKYLRPRMKQENYYTHYLNKRCLGSGEPIPFKNAEQYLAQDFLDKNQIRSFLKKEPIRGREWAINWLKKRKEEKGLIYAPSQVELRSLQCPSMPYYESIGGYYKITRELGFKDRYIRPKEIVASEISDVTYICDTREQLPLKLSGNVIRGKINAGDYSLAAPHDKGVYIERKSISDFAGTLNQRTNVRENKRKADTEFTSLERFDRELARAAEQRHYIVMVVENKISDALSFDYLPQMRWSKVKPSHCFKNLRDLLIKYPLSFQVVFVDGRTEAARMVAKVLGMGEQVRITDLQFAYEEGIL